MSESNPGRALVALLLLSTAAGCGGKDEVVPEVARHGWGDAAPVVIVERTSGVDFADEQEPNDSPAQAMALELPAGVAGTFAAHGEADLFKLVVDRTGGLQVEIAAVEGTDTVVEILDSEGEVLVHADNGGANVAAGVPNAPIEPGTYFVKVSELVKKRRRGKAAPVPTEPRPYRLTASYAPAPLDNEEREPNGSPDKAAPVPLCPASRSAPAPRCRAGPVHRTP